MALTISNVFVPGLYNVWIPQPNVGNVAATTGTPLTNGAFLTFNTLQEAVADVQSHSMGIVLDQAGTLDPNVQAWTGWSTFQNALPPAVVLNPAGSSPSTPVAPASPPPVPTPVITAGKYNVWVPTNYLGNAGITSAANTYNFGAYFAFNTQPEAVAYYQKLQLGLLVDPQGNLDANQPWPYRAGFLPIFLNSKLTVTPTSKKYNVWFPQAYATSLGLMDVTPYTAGGAYLAFDSAQEAQAHTTQRGFGVILDPNGDPDATQTWSQALQAATWLTNGNLKDKVQHKQFNVWFPVPVLTSIAVQNPALFPNGAFLAFKTEAEAQKHIQARGLGVILDPQGTPTATQPWYQASSYAAQLANANLSASPKPKKFNVYFPQEWVPSLGATGSQAQSFVAGAYLPFDTAQEAQAHVSLRKFGVVVDPQGKLDPTQPWNQAVQYGIRLTNTQLQSKATSQKFNVWFPTAILGSLGLRDTSPFGTAGAFLAFDSEQEAQAHVSARSFGVVLDQMGDATPTQPWYQAKSYVIQLANARLSSTPTANKYNVWFPKDYAGSLGVLDSTPFQGGAYLAFDTPEKAQAYVTNRSFGVILDPQGKADATQTWNQAARYLVQLTNVNLKDKPVAQKFNVWFPGPIVGNLGLSNIATFPTGAYLAFDTAQEAQAHVTARTMGVVLDTTGKPDAVQPWMYAAQYFAQLLNSQLTAAATPNQFNVWFPAAILSTVGVQNFAAFPNGAYLPFNSLLEAQTHASLRGFGLIIDNTGNYDPAMQVWAGAATYAPAPKLVWPPPVPVGAEAPYSGPAADIIGIYGQPKQGGAQVTIRTHNRQLNETLSYELFARVAGSEMKIKDLGSRAMTPNSYVFDSTFDIDYAELNSLVSVVMPGTTVGPNTELSVRVRWPSGHDQGAGGAGGQGRHRFIAP